MSYRNLKIEIVFFGTLSTIGVALIDSALHVTIAQAQSASPNAEDAAQLIHNYYRAAGPTTCCAPPSV